MQGKGKIYFASDFHLGVPDKAKSFEREQRIIRWLSEIAQDAEEVFLVGDLFDFWFEYKKVTPKGYIRFLGKLAELSDKGIKLTIFRGNHDMWMEDYFKEEFNAVLETNPVERTWNGKRFLIGHGDGLGPGDHGYKFLKKVFRNPVCRFLFRWLHPDIGISIADYWSRKSRYGNGEKMEVFQGADKEWLIQYAKEVLKSKQFDYFVFGHRHLPINFELNEKSRYINLGDWLHYNTYAVFDGTQISLNVYNGNLSDDRPFR